MRRPVSRLRRPDNQNHCRKPPETKHIGCAPYPDRQTPRARTYRPPLMWKRQDRVRERSLVGAGPAWSASVMKNIWLIIGLGIAACAPTPRPITPQPAIVHSNAALRFCLDYMRRAVPVFG